MISNGWVLDRWGNLKKADSEGKVYRIKMCKRVIRYEAQLRIANKNEWMRLRSWYYSKITDKTIEWLAKVIK